MKYDEGKLRELLDAIKSGLWTSRRTSLMDAGFEGEICSDFIRAFHGSLDAAKLLHDELLPEWAAKVCTTGIVTVMHPKKNSLDKNGGNQIVARAWLIAIIESLISEAGQ